MNLIETFRITVPHLFIQKRHMLRQAIAYLLQLELSRKYRSQSCGRFKPTS